VSPGLLVILAIALVGVVAYFMKRGSGDETIASMPRHPEDRSGPDPDDELEDASGGDDLPFEALAITSDGLAFMPRAHGVKVLPAADAREVYASLHGGRQPSVRPEQGSYDDAADGPMPRGMSFELSAGDLVAARVIRGAPDLDPWRLEGLGREHEMVMWTFETEEAARTALGLLEQRVVRPRRDEDGDPIPVGAEDWLVAERNILETIEQLAMPDDDEEPGAPEKRR
jgi:hypothetical protein